MANFDDLMSKFDSRFDIDNLQKIDPMEIRHWAENLGWICIVTSDERQENSYVFLPKDVEYLWLGNLSMRNVFIHSREYETP